MLFDKPLCPLPPPPPPRLLKDWILPYDHTQTGSRHTSAENFPVSQVECCRCTLLAGNSSISLAGGVEQKNFSQQSPKMLKMASESFIHALLLFLGLFLKISRWVPLQTTPSLQARKNHWGQNVLEISLISCKGIQDSLGFWRDCSAQWIPFSL